MLFFVLSGHVLWQACARHPGGLISGLPDWTLARLYRLYPAIIVSAMPLALLREVGGAELVRNMLLLSTELNGPTWSLQVELLAGLGLFLLHRAVRGRMAGAALALALSVALYPLVRGQLAGLGSYAPAFLAGALIGAVPAAAWRGRVSAAGLALLLLGSLFLGHGAAGRAGEILGAVAVVGSVGQWRPRALLRPVPLFLGRISYPLYLSHTLGLLLAERLVEIAGIEAAVGRVVALALLTLSIAIPVAWLVHVAVEAPMMAARPRLRPVRRSLSSDVTERPRAALGEVRGW
jgi:peptidoglycan/LPS O-acetylase OafA/YrhL